MPESKVIYLSGVPVGDQFPCYVVAEIGINHNGDIDVAKKLISYAKVFDFQCVKFQKRTPEKCVPEEQKNIRRQTPWGEMSYLEYRKKVEFSPAQYGDIISYCNQSNIHFSSSVWDIDSLNWAMSIDVPFLKVPSALITDEDLLTETAKAGRPVVISTGMSTLEEIDHAVNIVLRKNRDLIICHCHSTYPAPIQELNLRVIPFFKERYPECLIGYSGHEFGLDTTVMSVALGANFVERHVTIDRTMWGTDQMASVEPQGMYKLTRDIRLMKQALGDGIKKVYSSELIARKKLRGY